MKEVLILEEKNDGLEQLKERVRKFILRTFDEREELNLLLSLSKTVKFSAKIWNAETEMLFVKGIGEGIKNRNIFQKNMLAL